MENCATIRFSKQKRLRVLKSEILRFALDDECLLMFYPGARSFASFWMTSESLMTRKQEALQIMAIKDVFKSVEEAKKTIENLSIEDLKGELAANEDVLLLDIREIQETIDLGTIPGAIHVPRGMLEFWASPSSPYYREYFQENRRTVLFCAGGGRSVFATLALKDMGFTNVAHIELGFGGWQKAGEPVENVGKTSRWMRRPRSED